VNCPRSREVVELEELVCDYLSQLQQRGVLHYETGTIAGEYN
jgi:hypothetical protein